MKLSDKNKAYFIGGASLLALLMILLLVGEIVLPFIFAIFLAYLINPVILRIQKKIKNRIVALTSFFLVVTAILIGGIYFFGAHVIKDTKRLVSAVEVFGEENKEEINDIKKSLGSFVDDVYENEAVQEQLAASDTLTDEEKQEDVLSALGSVYSLLGDSDKQVKEPIRKPWSTTYMIVYTLIYTLFILYTYSYFEEKYAKYFANRKPTNSRLEGIWKDFQKVFMNFFRQRALIVFINMVILITAFSILNLPGAIIVGIVTAILSYASHFHYLSLPIVAIGCWVLSIENDSSFALYFGVLLAVFVLISILEETLYFNRIMKSINGMNPAIMVLAFALWIYVFGGFVGTVIALPLTELILIYIDKAVLFSNKKRKELSESTGEQE